jgi:hypothetical protein
MVLKQLNSGIASVLSQRYAAGAPRLVRSFGDARNKRASRRLKMQSHLTQDFKESLATATSLAGMRARLLSRAQDFHHIAAC